VFPKHATYHRFLHVRAVRYVPVVVGVIGIIIVPTRGRP